MNDMELDILAASAMDFKIAATDAPRRWAACGALSMLLVCLLGSAPALHGAPDALAPPPAGAAQ